MKKQREEWRVIADAIDYEVSSAGRLRRRTPGHLTYAGKEQPGYRRRDGYLWAMLRLSGGSRVTRAIHRIVCAAFHGPPPFVGAQVAHLDGTRTNNAARNLRWKTAKGNADDRELHGRTVRGTRHHEAKIDEDAVRTIRRSTASCTALAAEFGITKSTVSKIRRRLQWRHVDA